MKNKFKIEKARLEDSIAISKLECACYDSSWHDYANWFWNVASEFMWAEKATVAGKIVGGIVAFKTQQGNLYIDTIFVHPKFRRQGIARALVKRILNQPKKKIKKIQVAVEDHNLSSKKLFNSLGFKNRADLPDFYDEGKDYILLEK
ncbi:MAG: GNAT family N-acetyltransferase [Candidatus Nealsonbacteria bacterium]|nr:GNAT family N-acetyltransferase [Candidatus Nealsonbacteria bacterium]